MARILGSSKNFALVEVSTGYSSSDTSIVLVAGEGVKLPDPSTDGSFKAVWWNVTDYPSVNDDPNKEIVLCTARSVNTLTVTRPGAGNNYHDEGSENVASAKNTAGKTYKMAIVFTKGENEKVEANLQKIFLEHNSDGSHGKDGSPLVTGWIPSDALSYSSADSPTFLATISGDKTIKYSKGMKIRFEQDQPLTAYWNLDANSNSQVGSFNGTDTAITYTAGKFGNAATFNGTTSKIVLADNASLKPTGDFTLGLWFKTSNTGTQKTLFQSYSANSNVAGIALNILSSNFLQFNIGKNTGAVLNVDYLSFIGNTVVTDGNWHYVVVTFRNNYLQIYLDGKLELSSYSFAPVYTGGTNYVRIGCLNTAGSDLTPMNGQIDDVFLLNGYALDEKTIKAKYDAQTAHGTGNITIKKYGIITADPVYSSPNTILTIYCGTDYAVTSATISNPYFSTQKCPFGFPSNPNKWTVEVADNLLQQTSSPTIGTWYSKIGMSIPIGVWRLSYQVAFQMSHASATNMYGRVTLSTVLNAESDVSLTCACANNSVINFRTTLSREKTVSLSAKVSAYLTYKMDTTIDNIYMVGSDSATTIRAICALL